MLCSRKAVYFERVVFLELVLALLLSDINIVIICVKGLRVRMKFVNYLVFFLFLIYKLRFV